ncbi:MAG: DUF559 domain-containing protein [Chloroflexi bacterium]|nr:DUF559 domain-containing protein [Chloroflexota bacterium]
MSEDKTLSKVHPDAEALFQRLKQEIHHNGDTVLEVERTMSGYLYLHDTLPENLIRECESPIEQMLAVALAFLKPDYMVVKPQTEVIWHKDFPDQNEYLFRPDFVVGFNWTLLTPDWEMAARGDWWDSGEAYPWLPFFAVECDGRDYHNQHKAIERDKWRDRIFAARGMQVMRFTGSEIFRNAIGCARQVAELFHFMLRERLKPGVQPGELVPHGSKIVLGKRWAD